MQSRPDIRRQQLKDKGSILAMIVLLILLLSLSSMALIAVAQEARVRTAKNVTGIAARFAADAGIERAVYQMNKQLWAGEWTLDDVPGYNEETLTASNADYTVTFNGDLASGYQISSTGKSGFAEKGVRVTVQLTSPFADDYAVLTKYNLSIKNKGQVAGFNSADPSEENVPVAIGTLSTESGSIDLKDGAIVKGDIYVSSGDDPADVVLLKDEDSIEGEIFTMPSTFELPDVSPPDFTAYEGDISGNDVTLTTSDSGKYTEINIGSDGTLSIEGDVVLCVTGDITLGNGADLTVTNGSSLKLYVDGNIEAKNSSTINNESQIPSSFQLYGTGTDQQFVLKNSSDLYGVFYAPDAEMAIDNEVDVYGCYILKDFEMKNGGNVYYDKALKETDINDETVYFTVTHWEEL